jgi:hypothetical protein
LIKSLIIALIFVPHLAHSSCALVGDSIAHAAAVFTPSCLKATHPGINSKGWIKKFSEIDISTEVAVISMGSNEGSNPALADLVTLRQRVNSRRVMWIAPGPQFPSRRSVFQVATHFGDLVYERPIEDLSTDGIHFTRRGSKRIAQLTDLKN